MDSVKLFVMDVYLTLGFTNNPDLSKPSQTII